MAPGIKVTVLPLLEIRISWLEHGPNTAIPDRPPSDSIIDVVCEHAYLKTADPSHSVRREARSTTAVSSSKSARHI
jgi:hypothetical protein